MFMCFHVSVCAYIEVRGECLVSYSISHSLPCSFESESLTEPGVRLVPEKPGYPLVSSL